MTVTAIDPRQRRLAAESENDRLRLTARDLVFRARDLTRFCGHFAGPNFGAPRHGLSLDGAVYAAAGFWDGRTLRDPYRCEAHQRRRGDLPTVCAANCEDRLWRQCNVAFSYLAEGLRTPQNRPVYLATVRPSSRDFIEVVEANERLNHAAAMALLDRVCAALDPLTPNPPERSPLPDQAAGRTGELRRATPAVVREVADAYFLGPRIPMRALTGRFGREERRLWQLLDSQFAPTAYVGLLRLPDGSIATQSVPVTVPRDATRDRLAQMRAHGWRFVPSAWQLDLHHFNAAETWRRIGQEAA